MTPRDFYENLRAPVHNLQDEIDRLRSILRRCMPGAYCVDLGDGEIISLYQKERN